MNSNLFVFTLVAVPILHVMLASVPLVDAAPISHLSARIREHSTRQIDMENVLQPVRDHQQPEAKSFVVGVADDRSLVDVSVQSTLPANPALPVVAQTWMYSLAATRSLETLRNTIRGTQGGGAYTREYLQGDGTWDANAATNTQRMDGLFIFTTDNFGRVTRATGPVQDQAVAVVSGQVGSMDTYADAVYYADKVAGRDPHSSLQYQAWQTGHIISPRLSVHPEQDVNKHAVNFFPQLAACNGVGNWYTSELMASSIAKLAASSVCVEVQVDFHYPPAPQPVSRTALLPGAPQAFYVPTGGTYTVRMLATCPALDNHGHPRSVQAWYATLPLGGTDVTKLGQFINEAPANVNVAGSNVALTLNWANQIMVTDVEYRLTSHGASTSVFVLPTKRNYPINVVAGTSRIQLRGHFHATPSNGPAHTVTVNGALLGDNTWTADLPLLVGETQIVLKSNYEYTYTFKVTRLQAVTNFRLVCGGVTTDIAPVITLNVLQLAYSHNIHAGVSSCTLAVTYSVGTITVNTHAGPASTHATAALPMAIGANQIVVVSDAAGDGATFTLTVTRPQAVTNFHFVCGAATFDIPIVLTLNTLTLHYAHAIPAASASCTLAVTYSAGTLTINGHNAPASTHATDAIATGVGDTQFTVISGLAGDAATFVVTIQRPAH